MRLRSGKAILEMARPNTNISSTSNTQTNLQTVQEQSIQVPFNGTNVSTAIGVTAPMPVLTVMGVIAPIFVSTMVTLKQPKLVAFLPPPISFPMTSRGTNPLIVISLDIIFPSMPQFTLPMVTRYYPYGMPTTMMSDLQTNASTYADNTTTVFPPYNTHLASGYALSNPSQNSQPSLTTSSLMSLEQQMDGSNHDM